MSQVPAAKTIEPNDPDIVEYSPVDFDPSEIEFVGHRGESIAPQAAVDEAMSLDSEIKAEALISQIRIQEQREDARGRLAIIFTGATFALFVLGMIIAAFSEGNKVDNLKEIMITVSGIFSGLLGFVIGYYFRKGDEG